MEGLGECCGRSFASPCLSYSITICGVPERDRRKGYDLHQGEENARPAFGLRIDFLGPDGLWFLMAFTLQSGSHADAGTQYHLHAILRADELQGRCLKVVFCCICLGFKSTILILLSSLGFGYQRLGITSPAPAALGAIPIFSLTNQSAYSSMYLL